MMRGALTLALVIVVAVAALTVPACAQDRVAQGQRYFMDSGCYGCHTVGKMGTPIGPDLSKVGSKYSRTYLEGWLRDPSAQRPSAHMPKLELSPEQVTDLATYLSSLR
jgi:cytochrome c oxidase subunit II